MKKIFAFCLALFLLLSLGGCGTKQAPATTAPAITTAPAPTTEPAAESSITPILYQVTDENGHTIWLFGSIHVGRDDFYPLPAYVETAFQSAEALAVEVDIRAYEKDITAAAKDMRLLVYADGSTIQDHINPQLYADAAALLEDAPIPLSLLDRYMPSMWFTLIQSLALDTDTLDSELGIDLHMIDKAYEADKPVISIESASLQYGMLGSFSQELQILLLQSTVQDAKSGRLAWQTELLVDLWAEGDEETFSAFLNASQEVPEEDALLYEEYNKAMIVDRNISMTDFAENALKEGKTLMICVGAAHVVGDGAMAQLLQERGYTVTNLSPN